jgi:DnaJ like chaperone protein
VTGEELAYLQRVSELFGQSPLVFRRLKATHLGHEADDPYAVLGVAHDASDLKLRQAWKEMLSAAHPDRARARGLPPEFVEVAEVKAAAINAAFDSAMRERRAMALEGAA